MYWYFQNSFILFFLFYIGIDLAKRHPLPISPLADQSSKGIIFNSAYRNPCKSNMETYDFLQVTGDLVCSAQFTEYSWSNLEEYIRGTSNITAG